jgi:hypothetical protein
MAQDESVGVNTSQGVQVGSGNVQNNYYRPVDPSFLTSLSPHKAVARLRQMPHDDAVSALAAAPSDDATNVLEVMLEADETLAVALLADLNPRKTRELATLLKNVPWLAVLPQAVSMIARRASEIRWDGNENAGGIERGGTIDGAHGYIRKYSGGIICWSTASVLAIAVRGPAAEVYLASGGASGILGFPIGAEGAISSFPSGASGVCQIFEHGFILVSTHGAYAVSRPISNTFYAHGMSRGWLGFPVSEREDRPGYSLQRFEGGAILSFGAGTFAVRRILDGVYSGERSNDDIQFFENAIVTLHDGKTEIWAQSMQAGEQAVAAERNREAIGSLVQKREELERRVDDLRAFEREYRSRLKAYLEGQIRDLEALTLSPGEPPTHARAGDLRAFEREYRSRLKVYLEGQIRDLEAGITDLATFPALPPAAPWMPPSKPARW